MFLLYLIILNIYEFTMRKTIIHETDENASMDLLGRPQSNGPPMAQNEDPKLTLPTYRDDPSVSNRKQCVAPLQFKSIDEKMQQFLLKYWQIFLSLYFKFYVGDTFSTSNLQNNIK